MMQATQTARAANSPMPRFDTKWEEVPTPWDFSRSWDYVGPQRGGNMLLVRVSSHIQSGQSCVTVVSPHTEVNGNDTPIEQAFSGFANEAAAKAFAETLMQHMSFYVHGQPDPRNATSPTYDSYARVQAEYHPDRYCFAKPQ